MSQSLCYGMLEQPPSPIRCWFCRLLPYFEHPTTIASKPVLLPAGVKKLEIIDSNCHRHLQSQRFERIPSLKIDLEQSAAPLLLIDRN
jgi:hypothetical protein